MGVNRHNWKHVVRSTLSVKVQDRKTGNEGTDEYKVNTISSTRWNRLIEECKLKSMSYSNRLKREGQGLYVRSLASKEGLERTKVNLRAVTVHLNDEMLSVKRDMITIAREILTKAEKLGVRDPILPEFLASTIEGKWLYKYNVGEFFQLYGRFEGIYKTHGNEQKNKKAMERILANTPDRDRFYKQYLPYNHNDKTWVESPVDYPLPLAVRNCLAHEEGGINPNKLDVEGTELNDAIELLREWVSND